MANENRMKKKKRKKKQRKKKEKDLIREMKMNKKIKKNE